MWVDETLEANNIALKMGLIDEGNAEGISDDTETQLEVKNFIGLFILHFIGLMFAGAIFIFEYKQLFRKKKEFEVEISNSGIFVENSNYSSFEKNYNSFRRKPLYSRKLSKGVESINNSLSGFVLSNGSFLNTKAKFWYLN